MHDVFGRNIFLLTLNAANISLFTLLPLAFIFLFSAILISLVVTIFRQDQLLVTFFQSVIDLLSSLPGLLLGLAVSAVSSGSTLGVLIATSIMVLPHLIRFFESQINSFKSQSFYASSEALGANAIHLSKTHLFPELLSLGVAIFPFILSRLLAIETSLAFLGIGALSSTDSWGQLISQGKDYLLEAPWLIGVSGLCLVLTLWSFHLLTKRESS